MDSTMPFGQQTFERVNPSASRARPRAGFGGVAHPALAYAAATLPLIVAAFVDTPRALHAGPVSGMGLLTVAQVVTVAVALVACSRYPRHLLWRVLPYAGFLAWAAVRSVWEVPDIATAQNALVYVLFGLVVTLTGTLAANDPIVVGRIIDRGMRFVDYVALGLVALSVAIGGLPTVEERWVIGPRAVALLGLVALSWHLAQWQYGSKSAGMRSAAWVCAIVLSLSRTACAIAFAYVAAAVALQMMVSTRRFFVRLPAVAAASLLILAGIIHYIPFQERFFTGDTSMNLGGFDVNASGRLDIWAIVIESGQQSPLFGRGLGSSNTAVADLGETVNHPHNDYLRVWHDLGFAGMTLLLVAFGTWISTLRRAWLATRKRAPELAALQLAGYLGLLALMLSAVTDNALVYPFVMGPLGVLIGAGLGVSNGRLRTERTAR